MLKKIKIPTKPKYIKITEDIDYFEMFQKIEAKYPNCYILESLGEEESRSRHTIIGFDPKDIISATKKSITQNGQVHKSKNPYEDLRTITPQNVLSKNYAGGLVGYISYEAMGMFEKNLDLSEHDDFGMFMFGVYLDGLVYDKMTGELFYFYYKSDRSEKIKEIIHSSLPDQKETKVEYLGDTSTRDEHKKTVEYVLEEIRKGNTFQCEVGFKSKFKTTGSLINIYKELRKVNPSPHMYFLKFGEKIIIGASPELLLRLRNGEMETYPLAGTIQRGDNHEEDVRLARELLNDPKEIAEHNMLIDLHRNDLGKISRFGTVKVRRAMDIKKFSHVQHISSEIVGIIDSKHDMFSALMAVFPAGTLTGAPKIESMKIIDRNETEPRGVYGGAVGQFGFNGDCTFAIPIRTLFVSGEEAYVQTSGGIVLDSEPKKEYKEILNKLAAMKETLKKFERK